MFYFLQAYDDNESSVRKASVFCLVGIYMIVGEPLRPHLSDLNGSKVGIFRLRYREHSSSLLECLTRDGGAAGLSLTGVT